VRARPVARGGTALRQRRKGNVCSPGRVTQGIARKDCERRREITRPPAKPFMSSDVSAMREARLVHERSAVHELPPHRISVRPYPDLTHVSDALRIGIGPWEAMDRVLAAVSSSA